MYASEQKYLIDAAIARTHTNLALRIQLLTLESRNCKQAQSMITYEISAKRREYDLLVARTQADMMPWEIRGRVLEDMAQKHADAMSELHEEYAAFGDAKNVADAHIRQAQRAGN